VKQYIYAREDVDLSSERGEPEGIKTSEDIPPEDAAAAEREKEEKQRLASVASHIRSESAGVRLTEPAVFLEEPFSLTAPELEEVWFKMSQDLEYADIVHTRDPRSGDVFVHSSTLITVPYAHLMLRKRHDDPAYLIVETIRDESRIYPRPMKPSVFELEPFSLDGEEIARHVEALSSQEAYADIKSVEASTGAVYLYSDRYLNEAKAQSIVQWIEVDSQQD
jgi:hypothetical protein